MDNTENQSKNANNMAEGQQGRANFNTFLKDVPSIYEEMTNIHRKISSSLRICVSYLSLCSSACSPVIDQCAFRQQ